MFIKFDPLILKNWYLTCNATYEIEPLLKSSAIETQSFENPVWSQTCVNKFQQFGLSDF